MLRKEDPVGRGRCRCRCCCSFFRRFYWSQWCLKRCCSIGRCRIFCILLPAPGSIRGHFARWFLLLPPRPVPCLVLLGASSRRLRSRCLRSWVLKLTWILEVRRSDPWTCHCAQWTWDGHLPASGTSRTGRHCFSRLDEDMTQVGDVLLIRWMMWGQNAVVDELLAGQMEYTTSMELKAKGLDESLLFSSAVVAVR